MLESPTLYLLLALASCEVFSYQYRQQEEATIRANASEYNYIHNLGGNGRYGFTPGAEFLEITMDDGEAQRAALAASNAEIEKNAGKLSQNDKEGLDALRALGWINASSCGGPIICDFNTKVTKLYDASR